MADETDLPRRRPAPPRGDYDDDDDRRRDAGPRRPAPKNVPALLSYYFGVFSLIPFTCAILSPVALITGVLGIIRSRSNPQVRGVGHAITGIILSGLIAPLGTALFYWYFKEEITFKWNEWFGH